ncbi:hypothetical protein [Terasakiella pusilla]|uniref:hypothetical protein n=1 Tax=Terasakiella pusilla TaxID=64973 RepID=UPI003AA9D1A3
MPSFLHKQLLKGLKSIDYCPEETAPYLEWIQGEQHLHFLQQNTANDNELIIYASDKHSFVHTLVVPNEFLFPIDADDLLGWSMNPFTHAACYVSGGGEPGVRVEKESCDDGTKTLRSAKNLIYMRSIEGETGAGSTYCEVAQEFSHLTGIHWKTSQRAFCKYDENGDLKPIVSVTLKEDADECYLVTIDREELNYYLAASNASLVRVYDFTLINYDGFLGWTSRPEEIVELSENFIFRKKNDGGAGSYLRGFEVIPTHKSSADLEANWFATEEKDFADFVAFDWRNKVVRKISTAPEATTNYFVADQNDLPFELSPAFFRPEVLLKYKTDREKYTVTTRSISCRAAWSLRGYDVNEAGQIHAYICDLAKLPYSEQLHWLGFNEEPKTGISDRAFANDFKAEYFDNEEALILLKRLLNTWNKNSIGFWKLRDQELVDHINIPRTSSQDEWAEAVMDLSKLIVEGFLVKPIRLRLTELEIEYDNQERSISLLEKLVKNFDDTDESHGLKALRNIQLIRSKVKGHSAGDEAKKIIQKALDEHETFAVHFEALCDDVINELQAIEACFQVDV